MAERTVNPQDSVDLALLLQSLGDTLGTLYPQARVYDQNDTEITGSPFSLALVANNLYTKSNAFQVGNSGTYKVVYLVYTNAGHTIRSNEHGEILDIINVKIQSTTGLGGGARGDVIVDFDIVKKWLADMEKKMTKRIDKLQKDFDAGLKVEMPEQDLKPLLEQISEIKIAVKSIPGGVPETVKQNFGDIMSAIKKNRTMIVKKAFDKAMLKPMLEVVADSNLRITRGFTDLKTSLTGTIDMKNEEANKMFNNSLTANNGNLEKALNALNESIRTKLKFTLDGLKSLMISGRQPKQNINISLKRDV